MFSYYMSYSLIIKKLKPTNVNNTVSLTAKGFIHKYTVCVDHLWSKKKKYKPKNIVYKPGFILCYFFMFLTSACLWSSVHACVHEGLRPLRCSCEQAPFSLLTERIMRSNWFSSKNCIIAFWLITSTLYWQRGQAALRRSFSYSSLSFLKTFSWL